MRISEIRREFSIISFLFTLVASNCAAQNKDSLAASGYHPKAAAFVFPAAFIGYGLVSLAGKNPVRSLDLTTENELQEDHPLFAAHADNYLQFAPAAVVFGLHLAGVKTRHRIGDAVGIYLMSIAIMTGSVTAMKHITKRERPDHSVFNSFPSGHTATVFASAEFLKQEYGEQYPWLEYAGYAVATTTGALRMYNNRHWLSDVVAGAGFGILSTKLSYILYPQVRKLINGRHSFAFNLMPSYRDGKAGFYLCGNF
ncbi:phosphatase PAP2 family protein [Pedobacter psychroterrae]|uniref:Phosphatase PAP2 family protein n=2 Tax=Pedobacter psychroterrae TaxID=2530453 RepID=A0A4V2MLF4_9SPHI|nr:phosphatase PAP2 family protein [Pedobacter psychroterrae]